MSKRHKNRKSHHCSDWVLQRARPVHKASPGDVIIALVMLMFSSRMWRGARH